MTLGRSFFWLFVAEFLFYASGYVVHMGAGRILGVEDYGRYTLVITVTILVANLIGAGLPIAMGKFLSAAYAQGDWRTALIIKRKIALWQFLFMGVLGLGFFLSASSLAALLGDPTLTGLFALSSLIIPLYGADLYYFHYYSGLKRFDVQSWLKVVRSILRMSVLLALAYWFHLSGMIIGYILVPLVVFLLAWGIDKNTKHRIQNTEHGIGKNGRKAGICSSAVHRARLALTASATPIFSFGKAWCLAGATIAFLALFEVLVSFDVYFLKYFFGDDALVGEYNAALTIARIPTFLFYALTIILLPIISQSHVLKDAVRAKKLMSLVLKYMSFVTIGFVFFLVAFPFEIVELIFGDEFLRSALLLPGLGIALGLLTFLYVTGFAFVAASRAWVPVSVGLGALVINIALATLLAGPWGMLGIILAKVITALLVFITTMIALNRVFGARLGWRNGAVSLALIALLFAFGIYLSLQMHAWIEIILIGVGFSLAYFMALVLTGVISRDDLSLIREKA